MGVKVAKFGGSSVADAIQLKKVKEIISSDSERKLVVVSAPGKRYKDDNKITDLLYLCKTHLDHNVTYEQVFQVICDRFRAIELNLGVHVDLEKELDVINENLEKGCSADYIASRGEYLNAMLTAAYLGFEFVDTANLIKFDSKGRLLNEETNKALADAISCHKNIVFPGFYGALPDGKIKTFSRGGSDITGSLVAKAAKADVYENWTDVSGFLMADPRIVKDARPISKISYKELRELSYMGASVLHEDAIYPARSEDIPINIRNTNEPEHPGTIITAEAEGRNDNIITGIAGNKDFTVIALYKNMMSAEMGFIKRILSILEDYDVFVEHIPSGIDTLSLVISNDLLNGHLEDILEDFQKKLQPENVEVFQDVALIATVGCGMSHRPGVSSALFTALYKAGVNIRMIDQGSSEMNIIVGVENKDFNIAIKAIYDAFVKES